MPTEPTNLSPAEFALALGKLNACERALLWSEGMDYNTAWATCQNPEWMFFLINAAAPLSPIADELLACRFARTVVHLNTDPRVLGCIETREMWARGEATDEQRDAARDAARVAVWGNVLKGAWIAAWCAMWSATAAARAAARAVGDATWVAMEAKQCDIIRELVPQPTLG